MVNSVFKEPAYQILKKIKNEPYFKWPIRWVETCPSEIRVFTATIIRREDIQLRIVEPCVTTWVNW